MNPRWLDRVDWMDNCIRLDSNGSGVSEFTYLKPDSDQFLTLAVKRISGSGTVTLEVTEADAFDVLGSTASLPGILSASPNYGTLAGQTEPSLVIPTFVSVDPEARALNVLDPAGKGLVDWPVFLFPHPSSQGGLTQPLVWDFDGISGDEIVVASKYGSLYFFEENGLFQEVALEFNLSLTAPVGWLTSDIRPMVTTVNRNGVAYSYTLGPVLEWTADLQEPFPLPPAVGQLTGSATEELVISFAGGLIAALDENGDALAGWPVDLGVVLSSPPVLCDLDDDGFHEVIQPVFNQGSGTLVTRVLRGDGLPGPGDGSVLSPSSGGDWLALSLPAVAGGYRTGDLRVTLAGLQDNGETGDRAAWTLGLAQLQSGGTMGTRVLPGFAVRGITGAGVLTLDQALIAPLTCWNSLDGTASEANVLVHLRWQDILYGLSSVPGGLTGWFGNTPDDRPLSGRQDRVPGGPAITAVSALGTLLVPLEGGIHLRADVLDKTICLLPVSAGRGQDPVWSSARGDSRNSGAYPLKSEMAPLDKPAVAGYRLRAAPNPAAGRLLFSWSGSVNPEGILWEVFDLRGRRVRRLRTDAESGTVVWDAADQAGRPGATGSYLVRARSGVAEATTRVILQR